jgi:hypothetical protein
LALPPEARFCARCGAGLAPAGGVAQAASAAPAARRPGGAAPVWLQALLWIGAAGTFWVAILYGLFATGLVTPQSVGAGSGQDAASLRAAATLITALAASLSVAHVVAAIGLLLARPWARTFTTLVCVVWALTCVGLPVGLLGINALWRARREPGSAGP